MAMGPVRPAGFSGVQGGGRARRPGGGFALPEMGGETAASAALSGPSALGGLLALQDSGSAPPPEPPAERAQRRARKALDELRGLQLDLLRAGPGDSGRRARLEALAGPPEPGLEPGLAALMAEIRLRARLELARRPDAAPSSD
ncbi:flagellar assembly protein FliX [Roseomonas sp. F4]